MHVACVRVRALARAYSTHIQATRTSTRPPVHARPRSYTRAQDKRKASLEVDDVASADAADFEAEATVVDTTVENPINKDFALQVSCHASFRSIESQHVHQPNIQTLMGLACT